MENIKEYLKGKARKILKNSIIIGNLGNVEELDDRLICYVDEKKGSKVADGVAYFCSGIQKNDKLLAESYGLNKPVYYIFDGLNLRSNNTIIKGFNNCNVIIKNCKFLGDISISINGNCTIEAPFLAFTSMISINANELTIKNTNDSNISFTIPGTNISITASNLNIINSQIGTHAFETSLCADETLNITNSIIRGKNIECVSAKLNTDKESRFIASEKIDIQAEESTKINISTPDIIINGTKFSGEKVFKKEFGKKKRHDV